MMGTTCKSNHTCWADFLGPSDGESQECPCVTLTVNQTWLEWRFALPSGESCLALATKLLKGVSSSASSVNLAQLESPDSRAAADILPGSDEPMAMAAVGCHWHLRAQPTVVVLGSVRKLAGHEPVRKVPSSICARCLIYILGSE